MTSKYFCDKCEKEMEFDAYLCGHHICEECQQYLKEWLSKAPESEYQIQNKLRKELKAWKLIAFLNMFGMWVLFFYIIACAYGVI